MLIHVAGLQPTDQILDVGCGPGRIALALRDWLRGGGRYEGFDVREEAVAWARRNIAPGHDHIRFRHVDLSNPAYKAEGAVKPADFRFPYEGGSFDLVILFSVFTHLVKEDFVHYLGEVARVLAPGGRVAASFFLLDEPQTIDAGNRTLAFVHRFPGYLAIDPVVPEKAVAYPEAAVRELYGNAELEILEPIRYGSWRGREGPMNQDLIVALRR